jgi:hypothetical protein
MPITGWPLDSATHPWQLLECERSTPTGRPSGDRGWFRTELQLRPQDGKPRYAVRSPTSSVAPALSRPLSEGSDIMTTISAKSDVMTLINMFTVEPANQRRLVELLTEATELSMIIRRCVRILPRFRFFRKRSRSPSLNPASTKSCEPSHPPASRIKRLRFCPLCAKLGSRRFNHLVQRGRLLRTYRESDHRSGVRQDAARFRKTISLARSTKARKLAAMWRRPG